MRKLLLALALCLLPALASAQGNPQCPTRPLGDNTNACASTAFVYQNSVPTSVCSSDGVWPVLISGVWGCTSSLPLGFSGMLVQAVDGQDISFIMRQLGHTQSVIYQLYNQATNTSGADTTYTQHRAFIVSPTAGTEYGAFDWYTKQAGTLEQRMQLGGGLQIGAPSGGDLGTGKINVSSGYFVNGGPLRTPLSGNLTIYFATTGTDQASCVAPATAGVGNPCQTLQYAWNTLIAEYDGNGKSVFLRIKDGEVLTQGIQITSPLIGAANVYLRGNISDRTSATIRQSLTTSGYCASVVGATLFVQSLTCDGQDGSATPFDGFAVGQGGVMYVENLYLKGSTAPLVAGAANHFSLSNNASLTIVGDLYFAHGYKQVGFYFGSVANTYLNVNNVRSLTANGTLTSGLPTITFAAPLACVSAATGCPIAGDQIRGTGIPENTFINTISVDRQTITLKDVDGNAVNATANGLQSLVMGGIFFNFIDDGGGNPIFDVSFIFGTIVGGLNFQGVETSGNFTGQSYQLLGASLLNLGSAPLTVFPGTIPGFSDGTTFSVAYSDGQSISLELARVPSSSIFPTQIVRSGAINCTSWSAGPVLDSNSDCRYFAAGTGIHAFYNTGGSTLTTELGSTNLGSGIGIYATNAGVTGARFFNSADSVDLRSLATTTIAQLGTNSNHILQFYTNALPRLNLLTSYGIQILNDATTTTTLTGPAATNITAAFGTTSGTIVMAATSPLAINATTGVVSCSTCLTNTPAALTRVDDTNITLTLGGTPSTALLQNVSLTLGWTGTLAASRGGTGISSLGTGIATFLGTPSSTNLAAALTDETGTGAAVFATSPSLTSVSLNSTTVLPTAVTTAYQFDGSTSTFVVADTASVTLPTGSGFFIINNNDSGTTGMVLFGGGNTTIVAQTASEYVNTDAGVNTRIFYSGTAYTIKNSTGAVATYAVTAFKIRNSN